MQGQLTCEDSLAVTTDNNHAQRHTPTHPHTHTPTHPHTHTHTIHKNIYKRKTKTYANTYIKAKRYIIHSLYKPGTHKCKPKMHKCKPGTHKCKPKMRTHYIIHT
jgi:hypothetical protein